MKEVLPGEGESSSSLECGRWKEVCQVRGEPERGKGEAGEGGGEKRFLDILLMAQMPLPHTPLSPVPCPQL